MANIKQQKKRIVTAQRQRLENLRYRSTIKTLFNKLQLSVDTGDAEAAKTTHLELVRLIDRAITRGVLHRNTAARKKARAARMLLQEPKKDTQTTRKKKKAAPVRKPKAEATEKKAAEKKPAAKKAAPKKAAAPKAEAPAEEVVEETTAPEAVAAETTEAPAADAKAEGDEKA